LLLALLGAERLRARQVAGTLVAFAGIALFLSDKFAGGVARAGIGDLVLLVASALFSLYTVLVRPLVARYGPLIVLAYTLAFGAPPMVLLWAAPGRRGARRRRWMLARIRARRISQCQLDTIMAMWPTAATKAWRCLSRYSRWCSRSRRRSARPHRRMRWRSISKRRTCGRFS